MREHDIRQGDTVLLEWKATKTNRPYDPNPYTVVQTNGTVVGEYVFWDRIRIRIYLSRTFSTEYEYEYIRFRNIEYSNIRISSNIRIFEYIQLDSHIF